MSVILRRDKGFALTFDELDDNFDTLSGLGLTIANTAPETPADGQMWLDTGITQRTFAWSEDAGGVWLDISPSNKTTVSETEPATKNIGDAWFDTSTGGSGSLLIWNGNAWLEVIGAGGGDVAYGTLQEISTSGAIVLDKTTGGAWVRFFAAGGSGGGGGVYRSNAFTGGWSVDTSKGGNGGEISFYVPDVSVLNSTTLTLGAPGAGGLIGISNGSSATTTGSSATASTWDVGTGTITLSGGTGGGQGAVSTGTPVSGANGTDGTIIGNTSGFVNDTSYAGIPNVYEDLTNFLATGVTNYIIAGGEGASGGTILAAASSESAAAILLADPAGGSAGVRIVYDAG